MPKAVDDAQILLAHAAHAGIAIDPKVVATVVATGALCASRSISDSQECDFWRALDTLAKAVAPVTVASLNATIDPETPIRWFGMNLGRRSLARRAVQWYTGIAVLSLAILLLVQIYWLFGTAITGDILHVRQELDATQSQIMAYRREDAAALKKNPKPAPVEALSSPQLNELKARYDDLLLQGSSNNNLLGVWSSPWENDRIVATSCRAGADGDLEQVAACEKVARFQAATEMLNVMQRYFLPLLYGLLGACVYILRTLASQIRARTYSESSNIDFRIRLYLGTLGGMVSAWFLTPDVADGLFKSLSPFALAFLAGYGVELVFAAMDRIISAFTK